MRYAGLGMQIFVSLGIAVWAGYKADAWFGVSFPLLVWVLPLIVLVLMMFKLIRETSKKNSSDEEKE